MKKSIMKESIKDYTDIFFAFFCMGISAFGGAYALIPIVERELIKKRGWTNMDEVMDYYTIGQITPGLIAVNLSTFIGYKRKGVLGGIIATIAFIFPGITIIMIAAILIGNFAELPIVEHAFAGIRIAVGALILDTVIKLIKGIFSDVKSLLIYLVVFVVSIYPRGIMPLAILPDFARSPVTLVLASGLIGLLVFRQKEDASSGDKR